MGLHQGSVLSLLLFIILLDAMSRELFRVLRRFDMSETKMKPRFMLSRRADWDDIIAERPTCEPRKFESLSIPMMILSIIIIIPEDFFGGGRGWGEGSFDRGGRV